MPRIKDETSPRTGRATLSLSPLVVEQLVDWYARHGRDLPWRARGTSPWGVLVSEVMSQQTPVSRVAPIWVEWMQRWPTPKDFASASQAEVLRAWGSLGYPRRALRLHECATAVVDRHGGEIPAEVEALLALPGIGMYTARAVTVFAFRQRHPVVDTNVRRVVARLVKGEADGAHSTRKVDLRETEMLLPQQESLAADLSIAVMELGALVCTARSPRCSECPVSSSCKFLATGEALPDRPSRRPQRYHGTTRYVRGRIMELLRGSSGPVLRAEIDRVWHEEKRRQDALDGLVHDGLVEPLPGDRFALPE